MLRKLQDLINFKEKRAAVKVFFPLKPTRISDGYNFRQDLSSRRLGSTDEIVRVVPMLYPELASSIYGALFLVDSGVYQPEYKFLKKGEQFCLS